MAKLQQCTSARPEFQTAMDWPMLLRSSLLSCLCEWQSSIFSIPTMLSLLTHSLLISISSVLRSFDGGHGWKFRDACIDSFKLSTLPKRCNNNLEPNHQPSTRTISNRNHMQSSVASRKRDFNQSALSGMFPVSCLTNLCRFVHHFQELSLMRPLQSCNNSRPFSRTQRYPLHRLPFGRLAALLYHPIGNFPALLLTKKLLPRLLRMAGQMPTYES